MRRIKQPVRGMEICPEPAACFLFIYSLICLLTYWLPSYGWKAIIFAFLIGCVLGSVIHIIRMKVSKESHVLALGPYLAVGIAAAALWGDSVIAAYVNLLMG